MASYNGNIDLLSLNGAQVFKGIDKNCPERVYVCIPADLNEIKVEQHPKNPDRTLAKMRISIWPLNEQYRNAVRRSAQERGDSNVTVPTHEMQMSFSADYIKATVARFPKLVEQVKEANKDRDAGIVNQDPTDENTHLFKAIRNRMNKRLAMLYQPQPAAQQTPYPQQAYQTAGSATAYVAPADGQQNTPFDGDGYGEDDLPF